MTIKTLYRLLSAAMLSTALTCFGADPEPPKPKTEEPKPRKESARQELQAVLAKVSAKIKEGKKTESDLAPELKEFDALLASHKGEQTDDVAQILLMKAVVYLQVIDDTKKSRVLFEQLKKDYPNTGPGKNADKNIAMVEKTEESRKIQATFVPGSKFPDFAEKDLEGKPLSIAGYKGKVVLVDFWATWCGPCVAELPNVLSIYEKHKGHGFDIVGISLDEDEKKLKDFIASKKMDWKQYFDGKVWENKLAGKYGVMGIPATFLIDKNGNLIAKDLRGEELEKAVADAVAKN